MRIVVVRRRRRVWRYVTEGNGVAERQVRPVYMGTGRARTGADGGDEGDDGNCGDQGERSPSDGGRGGHFLPLSGHKTDRCHIPTLNPRSIPSSASVRGARAVSSAGRATALHAV